MEEQEQRKKAEGEREGERSVEKESCSWHRLMKLVSFPVDIISHLSCNCLPLFYLYLSFFLLGILCCVMRIFVHSLHGLPPKRTHSQSSYVSGTTKKKKLSWAAHKSPALSDSAKRFCLTLHLTQGWRWWWRRGKWAARKIYNVHSQLCRAGRQVGSWRCPGQGAQELSQLCVECTRPLSCVSLWPFRWPRGIIPGPV